MTTLSTSALGEVSLTLRGEAENPILLSLRRWPHWLRVDVERDPDNPERCLSVTLVADQAYESTVRDILKRGFGITFPAAGGDVELPPAPPPRARKRGWYR
ncbi:MAG: hypothetical protein IPO81_12925 [Kouleothrix sp.]|nr:hypothetical protein [Kouleothrix sp.]